MDDSHLSSYSLKAETADDSFYSSIPGAYQAPNSVTNGHNQSVMSLNSTMGQVAQSNQRYQPHQPSPLSSMSFSSLDMAGLTPLFQDLAASVDVQLPPELLKHVLTLISLGVPPDDVFMMLKSCAEKSKLKLNSC